ncbi:MAG: hypothetical protein HY070_05220 [Chloroflexi bacterium]|nr:hypothetical protein [Chloroflexota bacterium]
MAKNNKKRDPIPNEFSGIAQAAEFWETHDLTDYEDVWRNVNFKVNLKTRRKQIQLEPALASEFSKRARAKKIPLTAYVNRVLKDYLKRAA